MVSDWAEFALEPNGLLMLGVRSPLPSLSAAGTGLFRPRWVRRMFVGIRHGGQERAEAFKCVADFARPAEAVSHLNSIHTE